MIASVPVAVGVPAAHEDGTRAQYVVVASVDGANRVGYDDGNGNWKDRDPYCEDPVLEIESEAAEWILAKKKQSLFSSIFI